MNKNRVKIHYSSICIKFNNSFLLTQSSLWKLNSVFLVKKTMKQLVFQSMASVSQPSRSFAYFVEENRFSALSKLGKTR